MWMKMDENTIVVGIGEYAVADGDTKITTVGLGSCIGTIIYDDIKKVHGLSHIMLPTMGDKQDRIGKYADTALPKTIDDLVKKGALRIRLKAKIAGGASVFAFKDDTLKIGQRNIEAVKEILAQYKIRIEAEDVGGSRGRTIVFDPVTKQLFIKLVKKGPNEPTQKVI